MAPSVASGTGAWKSLFKGKTFSLFPTLGRFKALHPREHGIFSRHEHMHKYVVIQHIYDNLGVLAFAGVSRQQANKIGDILELVVKNGGPATLTGPPVSARRATELPKMKLPAADLTLWDSRKTDGLLTTDSMVALARLSLVQWKKHAIRLLMANFKSELPRAPLIVETRVHTDFEVRPFGIWHETANGDHRLTVETCVTTWSVSPQRDIRARVRLFAAGTGRYLGTVEFRLVVYAQSKRLLNAELSSLLWGPVPQKTVSETGKRVEEGKVGANRYLHDSEREEPSGVETGDETAQIWELTQGDEEQSTSWPVTDRDHDMFEAIEGLRQLEDELLEDRLPEK